MTLAPGFRPRSAAPSGTALPRSNAFALRNEGVDTRPVNLREGQVLGWLRRCFPASTALKHGMDRGQHDDPWEVRQTDEYKRKLRLPDLIVTYRNWTEDAGYSGARVVVEVTTALMGPHPFWSVSETKKARLDAAQAEIDRLADPPTLYLACLTQDMSDPLVLLVPWHRFESFAHRGAMSFAPDGSASKQGWIIPASATFGRRWCSMSDPNIFSRYQPPLEVHKAALREQGAPKRINAAPIKPNKLDELLRARTLLLQDLKGQI